MFDVYEIRKQFPMLNGKTMQGKPLVFLDNASTTFKPYKVIDAINKYYNDITSNSHRGDYDLCHNIDVEIEKSRKVVAEFINANEDEIVFTSGASMSINLVAYCYANKFVGKDDEIIISLAEHASNVLPWFKISEKTGCKIKYIPLEPDGRITAENLRKVITKRTKIVAVAHIGNVFGYVTPIKELADVAHEYGAVIAVDGAQSVPHQKVDVKELGIDFLSFSGHKMLGPTGIGVLWGKRELLKIMDTFLTGGGMNVKFESCGNVLELDAPSKFEAGTLNIEGILGLRAAIEFINDIGIDNITKHELELKKYFFEQVKDMDNLIIYNKSNEGGIITFNLKGVFAQDEATLLNSKGIACRSGLHCAKMLPEFLNEVATVRASTYLYNTKEDIDALVDALKNGGDILDAYFG